MTVEEYLAQVPEPARTTLEKVRQSIRGAAPKTAIEKLSYGMPAFHHGSPLAGYAAFKTHCGFFPMSGTVLAALAEELEGYETSKGSIRFALDKPLPATLIRKLVRTRMAEIAGK